MISTSQRTIHEYLLPLYTAVSVLPFAAGQDHSFMTAVLFPDVPAEPGVAVAPEPSVTVVPDDVAELVDDAVLEADENSLPAAPPFSQDVDQDDPGSWLDHAVDQSPTSRLVIGIGTLDVKEAIAKCRTAALAFAATATGS